MPVGAFNNLSPQQVEAVLAHELAYILRNDFILNIIQSVVETSVLFLNLLFGGFLQ
ncbi:MAG: M48 family metalloprotease [Saprospiraceae bacterium]